MRTIMTAVLLLVAAMSPVQAEDGGASVDAPPRFTMLLGFGTSIPGLGAGAEVYLAASRVSLFGAGGYMPSSNDGRGASGFGMAGGVRLFTAGRRHRGFVEASVSPAGVEVAAEGSGLKGDGLVYGPGVSLGYQFVGKGGTTVMASGGIAYGISGEVEHQAYPLVTFALGYTWRAQPKKP
jgi:hypothetical protein